MDRMELRVGAVGSRLRQRFIAKQGWMIGVLRFVVIEHVLRALVEFDVMI